MLSAVKISLVAGLTLGFAPYSMSDDDTPKAKNEIKAISDYESLKRYESTGEFARCVSLNRIDSTKVLDGKTIFFKMRGKSHYVNRMKRKCPSLEREQRFMYKVSFGKLCRIDTISVIDSFGRSWSSCGLGEFEEIKLKPKAEISDKPTSDQPKRSEP